MASEIKMDYGVVGGVSKGFGIASDVLKGVGVALEALVWTLRSAACFSFGSTAPMAQWLDEIKGQVKHLSSVCDWFSGRLSKAITDHKNNDAENKKYFED